MDTYAAIGALVRAEIAHSRAPQPEPPASADAGRDRIAPPRDHTRADALAHADHLPAMRRGFALRNLAALFR
ncbi:hypothetical protein ACWD4J_31840 [Streptomyces sp. NPDC002577]